MSTPTPPITRDEIRGFVESFWSFVASGAAGDDPDWRRRFATGGLVAPDGSFLDLEAHQALHRPLTDERHAWRELAVTTLAPDPPRVLVETTVPWEATVIESGERIAAEVDQRWIIERRPDGDLRFNLWWSPAIRYATDGGRPIGLGSASDAATDADPSHPERAAEA